MCRDPSRYVLSQWETLLQCNNVSHWLGMSGEPRQSSCHDALTHWGRVMHICVGNLTIIGSDNGLRLPTPSHYQNQCWIIVNWTLRNKLQWNLNRNSNIFIQENAFESVVCETAAILSRPQCVNYSMNCFYEVSDIFRTKTKIIIFHIPFSMTTLRLRQNGCHFAKDAF